MKVEVKENKSLTKIEKDFINRERIKDDKGNKKKDFDKDFEPNTLWFFVKDKNRIVSFGSLRPLTLRYLKKKYRIFGIGVILSIKKKEGYGKVLVKEMIKHLRKMKKTGLGFCLRGVVPFYKKSGLESRAHFIKRFVWVKKDGEKVYDNEGDGIYYEGKDKFVSKVLNGKGMVEIPVEFW